MGRRQTTLTNFGPSTDTENAIGASAFLIHLRSACISLKRNVPNDAQIKIAVSGVPFQLPLALQKAGIALCNGRGELCKFVVRRWL